MKRVKPKILAFNRFFEPGFRAGGPIRTLVNMASHFNEEFDFYILSTDRDKGDACSYDDVKVGAWNDREYAHVLYLDKDKISLLLISSIIKKLNPDLVYLNSFFDSIFTQRVLLARRIGLIRNIPIVLAPRGEFSKGALDLKSVKKKLYFSVVKLINLYGGLIWQASSQDEYQDIIRNMGGAKHVGVARDLAPPVNQDLCQYFSSDFTQDNKPLRLCFLARIVPMKNLDFALRALAHVRVPVLFSVYGPKEDLAYWALCESLIKSLPKNAVFEYGGEKNPSEVHDVIARHDLFFLPTRGENYGHVIHEALSSGVPVLISDRTPWDAVNSRNAGWAIPLDSEEMFAKKIEELFEHRASRLLVMRENALQYADEMASDSEVLNSNRKLLWNAINSKSTNTDISK